MQAQYDKYNAADKEQEHRDHDARGHKRDLVAEEKEIVIAGRDARDGAGILIRHACAAHEQSVGVDGIGRTGQQSDQIPALLDIQVLGVIGQDDLDLIHLIGQHTVEHVDIEIVALLALEHLGGDAVVDGQVDIDLRDIDEADQAEFARVEGLFIMRADRFIRFFIKGVGQDDGVEQAFVISLCLVKELLDLFRLHILRLLRLDPRLIADTDIIDDRADQRIGQNAQADQEYQNDGNNG